MRPPKGLPSTLVALGEAFARRAGIEPGDFWAYVYRRAAPPDDLRARIVEAFFPRVQPADFLLPSSADNATLSTMSATALEAPRKGRPFRKKKHPFVEAMLREGKTVAEVASDLKCSQAAVRSWYKDAGSADLRPIPKAQAEWLRDNMGVPLSAWRRVGT